MKLKGTMVLELTDETTGKVESITEENMVTEAVLMTVLKCKKKAFKFCRFLDVL